MPLSAFQKRLESDLKKRVQLRINDNRSTMLSVKWEPDCTKVSLHRFFLEAPENIMDALACYIRKEHKAICPSLKSFIEESVRRLDYAHVVDKMRLDVKGVAYNLKEIFDRINQRYFQRKLKLNITWYGKRTHRNRSQMTFGLYHEPLKLIKINRFLDRFDVPEYFISYVIYHEMLHYVCPPFVDEKGKQHIHTKEFKLREKDFEFYDLSQKWIEENREGIFSNF